jgi:hypothetical protein
MSSTPDDHDNVGDDSEFSTDLTVAEHRRQEEQKKIKNARRKFVADGIEQAFKYLSVGQTDDLAILLAGLVDRIGIRPVDVGALSDQVPDGHEFYVLELRSFIEALERSEPPAALKWVVLNSPDVSKRIGAGEAVLESIHSAAAAEGLLPEWLQDTQPVLGYQTQIGERYVSAGSRATGTLQLRESEGELKSILCAGGKGSGKTTAVETLGLDSYKDGHKIVDLVDFFKAENVLWDQEQQPNGEGLIDVREDMGLPTGFDDLAAGIAWLDDDPDEDLVPSPDMEILIPMCPGLEEMDVPAIAGEHPVVRPFTIPASDLTYRQLTMLLHHTTETRENELRSAHQALRDSGKDWTLADVAAEVKRSTNATEKVAESIATSLKTAQEKSFIRDSECPYALDWEEVMADETTVAAFTVHPVQETADHLVVLSYLIDSLFEARKTLLTRQRLNEYPPLTVIAREMHEIAPRSTSEQSAESTTEKYMIDSLKDVFALTRHANMEIIGDTQKFYRQLSPEVSGLFDSILAFRGHVPDIKNIFRTRVDNTGPAERVAQFKEPGKCAFVGDRGYRFPIKMAPPRSHHLEAKSGASGLGYRTHIADSPEKPMESPWSATVPERLKFDDLPKNPIDRFLEQYVHVVEERSEWVLLSDLHDAYVAWADRQDEEQFEQHRVSRRLHHYYDEIGDDTEYYPVMKVNGEKKQKRAHRRLVLDAP